MRLIYIDYTQLYNTGIIIMAHLVETMAYVGSTPWHGLGVQIAFGE